MRNRAEWRALVRPDLIVGFCRSFGACAQDDAVEDRLPCERMDFDHARIAQELREIMPHRAHFRRIGRAEVDQQHADFLRGDVRMVGGPSHAVAITSNGSERMRLPAPAWIALATAGATGRVPSPLIPPGASLLGIISTITSGASPSRGNCFSRNARACGIPATHSG